MNFARVQPILRIFDEAKAREFYVDFLGFTIDPDHVSPRYRNVVLRHIEGNEFCLGRRPWGVERLEAKER